MSQPLGKVTLEDDKGPLEFALGIDGSWGCSRPEAEHMTAYMNIKYSLRDYSPSQGQPGSIQVFQAAEWLKGFVAFRNVKAVVPKGSNQNNAGNIVY